MAGKGVELGSGYVSVVPSTEGMGKKLTADVNKASDKAGVAGGKTLARGLGGAIAAAGAVIGTAAVVGTLRSITQAASDMNEATSKSEVVFGDASNSVKSFASDAAVSMGMSQRAALEATGTFGNLFVSMGLAERKSADLSMSLVSLASDLASFNNTTTDEALIALRAGIVGETEPLKRFGVNLNEATLKERALRLGLVKQTNDTLPAAVKAQAAYSIIMEQTATAQGDFARTIDGAANSQRVLNARWEDAKVKLGEGLLPTLTETTNGLSGVIGKYNELSDSQRVVANSAGASLAATLAATKLFGPAAGLVVAGLGTVYTTGAGVFAGLSDGIANAVTDGGDLRTMYYLSSTAARDNASATTSAATAARGGAAAASDLAGAQSQVAGTAADVIRGLDGMKTAMDSIAGTTRTAKDAQLSWRTAILDAAAANRRVRELEKDGKKGTEEYARAKITQEQANIRLKDSTEAYREAQLAANEKLADASEKTRGYKGELDKATNRVINLKAKLDSVPKSKKAEVKAEIAQAERDLKRIKAKIDAAAKPRWVDLNVRASGGGSVRAVLDGKLTRFVVNAYGGIWKSRPGGYLSTIAERGVDEAAIPLENTPRSRALLAQAAARINGSSAPAMAMAGGPGMAPIQIYGSRNDAEVIRQVVRQEFADLFGG